MRLAKPTRSEDAARAPLCHSRFCVSKNACEEYIICLPKKAKFTPKFILVLMHAEKRETRQRSGNNHFFESQSFARAHIFLRELSHECALTL